MQIQRMHQMPSFEGVPMPVPMRTGAGASCEICVPCWIEGRTVIIQHHAPASADPDQMFVACQAFRVQSPKTIMLSVAAERYA
jgi:hypothetical protein